MPKVFPRGIGRASFTGICSVLWTTASTPSCTKTADEGQTNFVTDLRVTEPGREDSTVLNEIAERARSGTPEADTLIADGGYASAQNSVDAAQMGIDLVAPPRQDTSRGGIPASEFDIDFERRVHEHYQQLMRDRQRGHMNSRAKPPPKQRRQLAPAGPRPSAPGRLGKLPRRQ